MPIESDRCTLDTPVEVQRYDEKDGEFVVVKFYAKAPAWATEADGYRVVDRTEELKAQAAKAAAGARRRGA